MFNYLVTLFTTAIAAALFIWVWPWGILLVGGVAVVCVAAVLVKS
jgi:hypothetical protein